MYTLYTCIRTYMHTSCTEHFILVFNESCNFYNTHNIHIRMLIGIQRARGERRKTKNRQLRDSNPGCLTIAAINHWATKPPQKPASTILLSFQTPWVQVPQLPVFRLLIYTYMIIYDSKLDEMITPAKNRVD